MNSSHLSYVETVLKNGGQTKNLSPLPSHLPTFDPAVKKQPSLLRTSS